jgi:hypothetical protein
MIPILTDRDFLFRQTTCNTPMIKKPESQVVKDHQNFSTKSITQLILYFL